MPKSETTFQGMLPWLILAAIIILADQFTKTLNAGDKIVLYLETGTIYLAYFSGWMIEQDLGMI